MRTFIFLALPFLTFSVSPGAFADKLDDMGPAYSIGFNSAPPFGLPSFKNGDTLRIGLLLDESVPVKGTPWTLPKSLFKDVQVEVTLKDQKGKQVVKVWVGEGKNVDLTKYKAQLGDHFSSSVSSVLSQS